MDGIDVACIETDGERQIKRHAFASFGYDEAFRNRLRQALEDAASVSNRKDRRGCLAEVELELTQRHATVVGEFLKTQNATTDEVDVIAFHGQTVLHRPEQHLTLQLGDGAYLARLTGVDVVCDLRGADVAAGGQGAPLAPVYHRAMVADLVSREKTGPVAVLNVGGVANVTFVSDHDGLTAFDTGPGNALIDDWVYRRTGDLFDKNGELARAGEINREVLSALLNNAYFSRLPPKSLDRNHFNASHLDTLSLEDGAATLTAFTAEAIALAVKYAVVSPQSWLVCGGGRRNEAIMQALRDRLPGLVMSAEEAGFDGDAIEAEAWAYLGVRSLNAASISFPGTTGVPSEMTGGKLFRA